MTPIEFPKEHENFYNNLLSEIISHYRQYHMTQPRRKGRIIFLEELRYVKTLSLNFTSFCDVKVNGKNIITYLINLKQINIRAPFKLTDELKYIKNKNQVAGIEVINTKTNELDLSEFTSLKKLTIIDNKDLIELKGLDKLRKLKNLSIYNNPYLNDTNTIKGIINTMSQECDIEIDYTYYPSIIKRIKKEYSKYRHTFRETKWIEENTSNNNSIIKHTTKATGLFFSKLSDIIEEIIPEEIEEDIKKIYLVYWWIRKNINLSQNNEKNVYDSISTLEASTINYNKLFQSFLKQMNIKCHLIPAYNARVYDIHAKTPTTEDFNNKKSNFLLPRITINDNNYYCNPAKEVYTKITGEIGQTCFMKTLEELDTNWFPIKREEQKSIQLLKKERNELSSLKLASEDIKDYERRANYILNRFELHLTKSKNLEIEFRIRKEQIDDLLYLGVINSQVQAIINRTLNEEFANLTK